MRVAACTGPSAERLIFGGSLTLPRLPRMMVPEVALPRDARPVGCEMDMEGRPEDAAGTQTEGARRCATR